ncbi:hypothetical protein [Aurantiacibacter arachoides]|uniref:hypothetical protein n=1 Tax=Aurantiacibacter arachoides TaxID=1850444 RepID=UPI0010386DE0|nr:hypothetical protein [Aurantiacibacter arachoides]
MKEPAKIVWQEGDWAIVSVECSQGRCRWTALELSHKGKDGWGMPEFIPPKNVADKWKEMNGEDDF